ncbi:uncharacterized protein LOC134265267 [Saccostrea cucullata]|uniref:uncharacterized protein LOC134265267 n=1 Tax=Saccostrea cuccullata TaxID=36930 RepID=UPI002ED56C37
MEKIKLNMYILLVLMGCAVIFQLIGLVSPYWIIFSKSNAGLWKVCQSTTSGSICVDSAGLYPDDGWLKAVRGLSIFGFISLVVAAVMMGLKIFLFKDQKPIVIVALGTNFLGAFAILISIAVYAAKTNDLFAGKLFTYHFAFPCSILGMVTGFGVCVMLVLIVLERI